MRENMFHRPLGSSTLSQDAIKGLTTQSKFQVKPGTPHKILFCFQHKLFELNQDKALYPLVVFNKGLRKKFSNQGTGIHFYASQMALLISNPYFSCLEVYLCFEGLCFPSRLPTSTHNSLIRFLWNPERRLHPFLDISTPLPYSTLS